MDLKELVCDDEWINLVQDIAQWRCVVNTVMKFRIPLRWGVSDRLRYYQLLKKDFAT
jgi:hypothetical protein